MLSVVVLSCLVVNAYCGGYVRAWLDTIQYTKLPYRPPWAYNNTGTCDTYLASIRKWRSSIDELSPIGSIKLIKKEDGSIDAIKDVLGGDKHDTLGCLSKAKKELGIKITPCWGASEDDLKAIAAMPHQFVANMVNFTSTYGFDGFQIDEEIGGMSKEEQIPLMKAFDMWADALHSINASLTVYKGCVRNHLPFYLGGNCSATIKSMPHMDRMVGAGTYWNNTVDGFEALLLDEVLSVVDNPGECGGTCMLDGVVPWKTKLSIALCPHGCAPEVNLTQKQLYERVDLMTALGIKDTYLFLFDQTLVHPDAVPWMNALSRFRGAAPQSQIEATAPQVQSPTWAGVLDSLESLTEQMETSKSAELPSQHDLHRLRELLARASQASDAFVV